MYLTFTTDGTKLITDRLNLIEDSRLQKLFLKGYKVRGLCSSGCSIIDVAHANRSGANRKSYPDHYIVFYTDQSESDLNEEVGGCISHHELTKNDIVYINQCLDELVSTPYSVVVLSNNTCEYTLV